MDLILRGKKPELDMPYFGRQSRFFDFFYKIVSELCPSGSVYAETNSGSVSNAYMFAKFGYRVIVNDISPYSEAIARSVFKNINDDNYSSNKKNQPSWIKKTTSNPLDRAAFFASLIERNGYSNIIIPKSFNVIAPQFKKYIKRLLKLKNKNIEAYLIFRMDLFDYLNFLLRNNIKTDIMFMDFAWPWRSGRKTEEYDITANIFSNILNEKNNKIKIWDKNNVISNVLKAVHLARKVSKFVLLSNQSSNYPDPETLELALIDAGLMYEKRHTMTTRALEEDNLRKDKYFREYLYVIKGKQ
jgi:adenine-specific DNA methylase